MRMDSRLTQEQGPPVYRMEPGIVVFSHSMQLKYANEQARYLLSKCDDHRGTAFQKNNLLVEIVKLGVRVRELDSTLWDDHLLSRLGTQKTVRTTQGSFRLRAFGMPEHSCRTPQQIMIVIEDRQTEPRIRDAALRTEHR
jgi:hypothetical protein